MKLGHSLLLLFIMEKVPLLSLIIVWIINKIVNKLFRCRNNNNKLIAAYIIVYLLSVISATVAAYKIHLTHQSEHYMVWTIAILLDCIFFKIIDLLIIVGFTAFGDNNKKENNNEERNNLHSL